MANKLINMAIQTTNWAIGLLRTGSAAEARTYLGVGGGGGGGAVASVNGQTGDVILGAADVGAVAVGAPVSSFPNDAGYLTDVDIPGSPVISVNNKTGVVVLTATDVGAATTAQGQKADTALQPGDISAQAVSSVNNKTGAVLLSAADVGAATTAQGTKADTALQPASIGSSVAPLVSGVVPLSNIPSTAIASVGSVTRTSGLFTASSTAVDIPGMSLAFTKTAAPVVLSFGMNARGTTAYCRVFLVVNGSRVANLTWPANSGYWSLSRSYVLDGLENGTEVVAKLQIVSGANGTAVDIYSDSEDRAFLFGVRA